MKMEVTEKDRFTEAKLLPLLRTERSETRNAASLSKLGKEITLL